MQQNRTLIFSGFLYLISLGMSAQPSGFKTLSSPDEFREKMAASVEKTISLQSSFIQEKNLDVFQEVIISNGVFYYRKENHVRWEYLDPISYVIVMNGDQVMIRSNGKTNTYDMDENAFIRQINEVMVGSVQGKILDNEDMFEISYFENAGYYLAVLVPRQEEVKDILKQAEIYFRKDDLTVDKLIFTEYTGDYTLIRFTEKRINETIPERIFALD